MSELVRVGPTYYKAALQSSDKSKLPTLEKISHDLSFALHMKKMKTNTHKKTDEELIETAKTYGLSGKTVAFVTAKGVYVDDEPEKKDILTDQSKYESLLRRQNFFFTKNSGIEYSEDLTARFIPHGFKRRENSLQEFSENNGLVGLIGKQSAIELAKVAKQSGFNYAWIHENFATNGKPRLVVPTIHLFTDGVYLLATDINEYLRHYFIEK